MSTMSDLELQLAQKKLELLKAQLAEQEAASEPQYSDDLLNVPYSERLIAKNFAANPEAAKGYLQQKHPNMDFVVKDGEVFGKGKNEPIYKALDPSSLELADIGDIAYDMASGIPASVGAMLGTVVNPGVGTAAGGAAGLMLAENLKQQLGQKFGIENNRDIPAIGYAGLSSPVAAVGGPLVSKGISKVGSAVGSAIEKTPFVNDLKDYLAEKLGKMGKKQYEKAFSKIDQFAADKKKAILPSEILAADKKVMGYKEAAPYLEEMNKSAGRVLGDVYDEATKSGVKINSWEAFKPAFEEIKNLRAVGDPDLDKRAKDIEDRVLYFIQQKGELVTPSELQSHKQWLGKLIKESGWDQGAESSAATAVRKTLRSSEANATDEAVKNVSQDLYDKLKDKNKLYSSTSNSITDKMKNISNQVSEVKGPLGSTKGDWWAAAVSPLAAASGKIGQALSATKGRSFVGSNLLKASEAIANPEQFLSNPNMYNLPPNIWNAILKDQMEKVQNEKK